MRYAAFPGITVHVRVKKSKPHGHIVQHACLHCGFKRRYPAPPRGLDQAPSTAIGANAGPSQPAAALELPLDTAAEQGTGEEPPEFDMDADGSSSEEEAMQVDGITQQTGMAETLPARRKRMPQRQRRKAGNLARLVARRVEQDAALSLLRDEPEATRRKKKRGGRRSGSEHEDGQLLPAGPLSQTLEQGRKIAEHRLAAHGLPIRLTGKRTNAKLMKSIYSKRSESFPTRAERRIMQAMDEQEKIDKARKRKQQATGGDDAAPSASAKRQKKQKKRAPVFHERMAGSAWREHLQAHEQTALRGDHVIMSSI